MEGEYVFNDHIDYVHTTLARIVRSHKLNSYFKISYLNAHVDRILDVMRYFNRTGKVAMLLDDESLSYIFTLSGESLEILFTHWRDALLAAKLITEAGESKVVALTLRKTEAEQRTLLYEFTEVVTNRKIGGDELTQEEDAEKMRCLAEEHTTSLAQIGDDLNHFMGNTVLKEYFIENELIERRKWILEWIAEIFMYNGVLLHIDYKQPYIYQQLFVHSSRDSLRATLNKLIANKVLKADRRPLTFTKNVLVLKCQELNYNSSLLRDQYESNHATFSNREDYATILKEGKTVLLDVCTLVSTTSNICESLIVLRKNVYNRIIRSLENGRQLCGDLLEAEERASYRAYALSKEVDEFCQERTDATLQSAVEQGFKIEKNLDLFLCNRSIDITDRVSGIDSGCNMMDVCISRVVEKGTEAIEDRGGRDAFKGILELTRRVIPLDQVNEDTFPMHMRDKETPLLISDHKRLNSRISTVNCVFGKDWLSQCIVPCIVNKQVYCAENMVVNNIDIGSIGTVIINMTANENEKKVRMREETQQDDRPLKKRRKRVSKRDKKVRLVTSVREKENYENDSEDDTINIVVESKTVINPDFTERRTCPACDRALSLKRFCQTDRKKSGEYNYLKNVCNSCRTRCGMNKS